MGGAPRIIRKVVSPIKKVVRPPSSPIAERRESLQKQGKKMERKMSQDMSSSPNEMTCSTPLGDLRDYPVRKLLVDLIFTLNATFPDYDFSSLSAENFLREKDINVVINSINTNCCRPVETKHSGFMEKLLTSVDDVISIKDCDVFSYIPDDEHDPLSEGCMWSLNYFFCNKLCEFLCFIP